MPERQFVRADTFAFRVQRSAPHFGAKGTRIGLFSDVENDFRDVGFDFVIGDVQLFYESGEAFSFGFDAFQPHIHVDRGKSKIHG